MRNLDPFERVALADAVLAALRDTAPLFVTLLRGSLAEGRADVYSDMDVLWEVPDADFLLCVGRLRDVLGRVRPIESFRSDPDLQRSPRHRLFFVRFAAVPLFWRLDLEVFAGSVGCDPACDLGNPAAK